MHIDHLRPRQRGPVRILLSLLIAVAIAVGGGAALAPVAHAADLVTIPDASLRAGANAAIAAATGTSRPPGQDITADEALVVARLTACPGPIADLTGLQAFSNLTDFLCLRSGNTYTDLRPLSGLTKLTNLYLVSGQVSDLTPLGTLTQLRQLAVVDNQVSNLAPLSTLTNLTSLDLSNNRIRDLDGLPAARRLAKLVVTGNDLDDSSLPALVGTFDPTYLATLKLDGNRITDASVLAPLGENAAKLGNPPSFGEGLHLGGNRIADFSAFASWLKPPTSFWTTGQTLYVGTYPANGLSITLKNATGAVPTIDPAVGSYDPDASKLTLVDPATETVTVGPNWTVTFTEPPLDPGDENGPTIGVRPFGSDSSPAVPLTGAAVIGDVVSVLDPAAAFGGSCDEFSYRWLRDGEEFSGARHHADRANFSRMMGGPGASAGTSLGAYVVSATDVGHRLAVRVTCQSTGAASTSAPTAVVTADEVDRPVVQDLDSWTELEGAAQRSYSSATRSGVVGEPDENTIPVYVGQLDSTTGRLVDPARLTLALTDIRQSGHILEPLSPTDVTIAGTGAYRTITITPPHITDSVLTFTVTGTTGKAATFTVGFRASMATTPTSRVLLGSSDASSAIAVGGGHLMVIDDEKRNILLYDATRSGREVAQFALPELNLDKVEVDGESAARKGNLIWWLGSFGKDKDGKNRESRNQIFQTTLSGSGANARLTPTGVVYTRLIYDMIEWDQNHNNRLGFYQAVTESSGIPVNALNGFNIEGAEFSPDGSQLYLGFRSPISPAQVGGKALIVTVTNLEDLTSGEATKATFGEPILLDLAGHSIRDLRKNAAGEYLILSALAGPANRNTPTPQALWAWNGDPNTAPRKLSTTLPTDVEPYHTDNPGAWEGIGEMPARLAPGAQIRLIMDQGNDRLYGEGSIENKGDNNAWTNKTRTDLVTLAGAAGTLALLSDPGSFGYQTTGTLGVAKGINVTNVGSNLLHVGSIRVADSDGASADEFMISTNNCTGQTLSPGQTCTVRVRFAPSRGNTTSNARLVVTSDVPDGEDSTPLTGTTITPIDQRWTADAALRTLLGPAITAESGSTTSRVRTHTYGELHWSPPTGVHELHGAILGAYRQQGSQKLLGVPSSDEVTTIDGEGRYNTLRLPDGRAGALYWSPSTPACVVRDDIYATWVALGAERSLLGYPRTSERITPGKEARYNSFVGGGIYWTPTLGANAVHGQIYLNWAAQGYERGPLQLPTTSERSTPDGQGRYNHFQGGSIYWSPATDAHTVRSGIRATWGSLGWERSQLGYPVTDELGSPDGRGRYNHFQGGSIYWSAGTGAHEVRGRIRAMWASMGWERSWLGYPTSDEHAIPGGRRSNFTGGWLEYHSSTGKVTVHRS